MSRRGLLRNAGGGGGSPPASWLPTSSANLKLWLRGDVLVQSGTVSQWTDQSGLGNHFAQGTGANQPTYVASAINGQPGMTFDGVNDSLVGPALSSLITNTTYNLFVAIKPVAIARSNSLSYLNDGVFGDGGGYGLLYLDNGSVTNGGTPQAVAGNFVAADTSARANLVATTNAAIIATRHNGGNIYCSVNSGAENSNPSGNTGSLAGLAAIAAGNSGGTLFGNFTIAEIILYNVDLDTQTAGDRAKALTYLKNRYGTP